MISLKNIFTHIVLILFFIACEINNVFLYGTEAEWYDFLIFYAIDITYFYAGSYWLLDNIETRNFSKALKFLAVIAWVALWSAGVFLITLLVLKIHGKELSSFELMERAYKTSWRRGFLFLLAAGFGYARISIKRQKLIIEKELQLINQERLLMEQERTIMKQEIALLRAKVDPHLLLNTFTKVHVTVSERCPELTSTFNLLTEVLHLSLEGSDVDYTSLLQDEIHLTNTFVELNKEMMLQETFLEVEIDIPEQISVKPFPPKLLINAVENLFKFGLINDSEKPALIKLTYASGTLFFETKNWITYPENLPSHNIGLENMKQRLDVHFPNSYTFNTKVTEAGFFELKLALKL